MAALVALSLLGCGGFGGDAPDPASTGDAGSITPRDDASSGSGGPGPDGGTSEAGAEGGTDDGPRVVQAKGFTEIASTVGTSHELNVMLDQPAPANDLLVVGISSLNGGVDILEVRDGQGAVYTPVERARTGAIRTELWSGTTKGTTDVVTIAVTANISFYVWLIHATGLATRVGGARGETLSADSGAIVSAPIVPLATPPTLVVSTVHGGQLTGIAPSSEFHEVALPIPPVPTTPTAATAWALVTTPGSRAAKWSGQIGPVYNGVTAAFSP